jgi:hypothetical protein
MDAALRCRSVLATVTLALLSTTAVGQQMPRPATFNSPLKAAPRLPGADPIDRTKGPTATQAGPARPRTSVQVPSGQTPTTLVQRARRAPVTSKSMVVQDDSASPKVK